MASPRELSIKPKELIDKDSIADAEIELKHLSPGLFGEIRSIKTHGHEGVSAKKLTSSALEISNYLPKIQVHYQTDESNLITNHLNASGFSIQFGWVQVVGSGANTSNTTVTFPTVFTSIVMVLVGMMGAKVTSAGADITNFTLESAVHVQAEDITTSSFAMRFNRQDDEDVMSATSYYAASWIAIGVI